MMHNVYAKKLTYSLWSG